MIHGLAKGLVCLALSLAAACGACAALAAEAPVRLCYNEALGGADSQHFSISMLRDVAAQMPQQPMVLVPLPWLRCQALASRGDFDGIVGASYTEERARTLVYPRNAQGSVDDAARMFQLGEILVRRKGTEPAWNGKEFRGGATRVGTDRGSSSAVFARAHGVLVDEDHPSTAAMVAKLRAGRLDAVLMSEPQAAGFFGPNEAVPLEVAGPRVINKAYFLVFSKAFVARRPALADTLWQAVVRERALPGFVQVYSEQQGFLSEGAQP